MANWRAARPRHRSARRTPLALLATVLFSALLTLGLNATVWEGKENSLDFKNWDLGGYFTGILGIATPLTHGPVAHSGDYTFFYEGTDPIGCLGNACWVTIGVANSSTQPIEYPDVAICVVTTEGTYSVLSPGENQIGRPLWTGEVFTPLLNPGPPTEPSINIMTGMVTSASGLAEEVYLGDCSNKNSAIVRFAQDNNWRWISEEHRGEISLQEFQYYFQTMRPLPRTCELAGVDRVDGFEFGVQITDDLPSENLSCWFGLPNSDVGIFYHFSLLSEEQWQDELESLKSEGVEPHSDSSGKTFYVQEDIPSEGYSGTHSEYVFFDRGLKVWVYLPDWAKEKGILDSILNLMDQGLKQ